MSDDIQVEKDINPYIMAALGAEVIGMKYGDLYQALGKSLREDSTRDEALDLLCVAWLFYRGYWKKKEE